MNATVPTLDGIDDFSTHELAREGAGGFVELWPMVQGDEDNIVEVLAANRLARRVKGWIGNRQLPSGKPIRAGDILILLRKRGKFFELLLSALQSENVQVAGADRMQRNRLKYRICWPSVMRCIWVPMTYNCRSAEITIIRYERGSAFASMIAALPAFSTLDETSWCQ